MAGREGEGGRVGERVRGREGRKEGRREEWRKGGKEEGTLATVHMQRGLFAGTCTMHLVHPNRSKGKVISYQEVTFLQ